MTPWSGKWALVTGASAGIGAALAEELARGGTNLVLTARRQERLEELAQKLAAAHKIQTRIFVADLTQPDAPEKIFQFTKEQALEIELLINNAGFGVYERIRGGRETQRLLDMVQVNCSRGGAPDAAVSCRTWWRGRPRRRADCGLDGVVSGLCRSFRRTPPQKRSTCLFAEGLAEESDGRTGCQHVCALCPGSTESEFAEVAGQTHIAATRANRETADKVARTGLRALAAGKSYVISGLGNYLGVLGQRLVSRRMVARIAARMFKPPKHS